MYVLFFTPGHAHGEMTEEREEAIQPVAAQGRGLEDPIEGEIGQGSYTYFSDILKFFSVRDFGE